MDADGMQVDLLEDLLDQLAAEGRPVEVRLHDPEPPEPGRGVAVGRTSPPARRARGERDLLIVEDNPYGLLSSTAKTCPSMRSLVPDRVIYVGTVSKTFAPGVRTGWVAAPRPIRDKLVALREAGDLCPSNLTQMVVEGWLATQPWREQIKRFREVYREKAEAMLTALDDGDARRGPWTVPAGAFYVWLTVPRGIDTSDLLAKAINHRVAYVPGRVLRRRQRRRPGTPVLQLPRGGPDREGVVRLGELLHDELELVRAVYGDDAPEVRPRAARAPGIGDDGG
jgi:2-aminoadipate transaminase